MLILRAFLTFALIYMRKQDLKERLFATIKPSRLTEGLLLLAEAVGFEPTWPVKAKQFSRLPRYDRFDKPPYLKAIKYT